MLVEAGLSLAAKDLFKRTVTDVYDFIAKKTRIKVNQWNTERKIENLYKKIEKVRKVKTIWQVDKAVDLGEFYCDSRVVINKKRLTIHQLNDFPSKDNLLIQGIAGQGKSIFLRYLCAVELGLGNCIPIFLELRRISKEHSLRKRIYISFKSLGLDVDDVLFDALADSGKIVLLLDAFDEVPDDLKSEVLTEIEDLASTHENLRIITTSRPDTNIQMSSQLSIVLLNNLQNDDYEKVIKKLASGEKWADLLIRHIKENAKHIQELLFTPLMVTLLVLSYKSYQKLPDKMADFYDSLFQTLLQRHDGTKPGFTRERGCALDDSQYRKAFEALCILAKKNGAQSFSYSTVNDLSAKALKLCSLDASPEQYVKDIVKITCLILRDGEEHRFIHKTVQEYYTAAFIARQPDSWAKAVYRKLFQRNSHEWNQELEFLSEIDTYRYNRYYMLPALLDFLEITENDLGKRCPVVTETRIHSVCKRGFAVECDSPIGRFIFGYFTGKSGSGWVLEERLSNDKLFILGVIGTNNFLSRVEVQAVREILSPSNFRNRWHESISTVKFPNRTSQSLKNVLPLNILKEIEKGGGTALLLSDFIKITKREEAIKKELEVVYFSLFKQAQELKVSLQSAEKPGLLEGLI